MFRLVIVLFVFCSFCLFAMAVEEGPPVVATVIGESHICPTCGKEHSILTVIDSVTPEPVPNRRFLQMVFRPFQMLRALRSNRGSSQPQVSRVGSDQSRAEGEAREMARLDYRGHLADTIGDFEGVGWSCRGTPDTCSPSKLRMIRDNLVLTGDAIASAPCPGCSGIRQYRVRSWRSLN